METLGREDLERYMFFEQAREQAQREYDANPRNAQALTRWGGSLLELAHFSQGNEAYDMIDEAVSKFKMALAVEPRKHEALWCLGNAYTSQGFLTSETRKAHGFFDKATDCFTKALAEDPTSEVYKKALEMTSKAPQLHAELQKQLLQHEGFEMVQGGSGGGRGGAKSGRSEFWWDVAGWATLLALGTVVVSMSKGQPGPAAA